MIGGKVTEVIISERHVTVHLLDRTYGDRMWRAMHLNERSRCVGVGDSIWWHGAQTLWTPVHNTNTQSKDRDVDLGKSWATEDPRTTPTKRSDAEGQTNG